jgi:hypothetical protein
MGACCLFDQQSRARVKEALFDQQEHRPRGSAALQWGGKIEQPNDNQQRCQEMGGDGTTTQTTIILHARE